MAQRRLRRHEQRDAETPQARRGSTRRTSASTCRRCWRTSTPGRTPPLRPSRPAATCGPPTTPRSSSRSGRPRRRSPPISMPATAAHSAAPLQPAQDLSHQRRPRRRRRLRVGDLRPRRSLDEISAGRHRHQHHRQSSRRPPTARHRRSSAPSLPPVRDVAAPGERPSPTNRNRAGRSVQEISASSDATRLGCGLAGSEGRRRRRRRRPPRRRRAPRRPLRR